MKNIILKELKLTTHPAVYLFSIMSLMLIIPAYPYTVGLSYSLMAIFLVFSMARADNDHEFMAVLPIPRRHIVGSKFFAVSFIQLVQLIVAIPFAILSSCVINKGGNIVGMDANFSLFAITILGYALFNFILLPKFFKTGYKAGFPVLLAVVSYIIFIAAIEVVIALIPPLKNTLDSLNPSTFIAQIGLLLASIVIYLLSLWGTFKISCKNFEKVSI